MSTQEEINSLLAQGYSPADLIQQGYKKSTVYKVYSNRNVDPSDTNKGSWYFEAIRFSKDRYLPGEIITVQSRFKNHLPYDFYVANVGIQPEWMPSQWYQQKVRDLIRQNESKKFTFTVPVPSDLPLGEYTFTFGVEGQYLGTSTSNQFSPYQTEWSEPGIFHIKHPHNYCKIFFSHSTQNKSLVKQIESYLDNYGYEVIIAEDIKQPGVRLSEKFQRLIRESRILIALLTHESLRSKWVIEETNYANSVDKPLLLLKDKTLSIQSDLEWVEFSRYDPPEEINRIVINAVKNIQQRTKGISPWLGVGLLGLLLLALASGSGSSNQP